ncbi:BTB/POZ domain-containing protein [Glycine soja]|uniref:BTB/POZ domain-containing protein n=1 Tax=Glycine soja TaxID=3848 RepID=A0A0B2QS15_GLYSO|nr:BTB/POZ domain-containing protein [Glycine soja]
MKKQCCEESETNAGSWECWFDDACIVDMDYFVKTLSSIKQKGVRADLIGSIITHYASILDRDGAALLKVAKLVDCYLDEAAVDANLTLSEFITLAGALPSHARAAADGLYRAIDTYLKNWSFTSIIWVTKVCIKGIDYQGKTPILRIEKHERLPVGTVIQVLFSEQTKLHCHIDWSGSFNSLRSPNGGLDPPGRCLSKREMNAQQMEIRKLKEDVYRLQSQFNSMQVQKKKAQC